MAIREKLIDTDTDDLGKDVDDLDAAYIIRMQEQGIDPDLVEQFTALLSTGDQKD